MCQPDSAEAQIFSVAKLFSTVPPDELTAIAFAANRPLQRRTLSIAAVAGHGLPRMRATPTEISCQNMLRWFV
jgi:hypothetical protein